MKPIELGRMRIHRVWEMDSPVPLLSQLPGTTADDMKRIRDILSRHPGGTPVVILVDTWDDSDGAEGNGVRVDAAHQTPPDPAGSRIRAFLTTPTCVSANAALKQELDAAIGRQGYRYVAETSMSRS